MALYQAFLNGEFTDFTFRCRDGDLFAHKAQLCHTSEYFRRYINDCGDGFKSGSNTYIVDADTTAVYPIIVMLYGETPKTKMMSASHLSMLIQYVNMWDIAMDASYFKTLFLCSLLIYRTSEITYIMDAVDVYDYHVIKKLYKVGQIEAIRPLKIKDVADIYMLEVPMIMIFTIAKFQNNLKFVVKYINKHIREFNSIMSNMYSEAKEIFDPVLLDCILATSTKNFRYTRAKLMADNNVILYIKHETLDHDWDSETDIRSLTFKKTPPVPPIALLGTNKRDVEKIIPILNVSGRTIEYEYGNYYPMYYQVIYHGGAFLGASF